MHINYNELISLSKRKDVSLCSDSRMVKKGDIFIALHGEKYNGHDYIDHALANGAAVIVCEEDKAVGDKKNGIFYVVSDSFATMIELAKAKFETNLNPARLIGITGTNGKTTCSYLLEHLFQNLGEKTGIFGTISWRWPGHSEPARLTTPDVLELHSKLHDMAKIPCRNIVMEVSSHALTKKRVNGLEFDGAIFTNLTQDHLDFHKNMENYFNAKEKLFTELPKRNKSLSINTDDAWGQKLFKKCPSAIAYGFNSFPHAKKQLIGKMLQYGPQGITMRMTYCNTSWEITSSLMGGFNAFNLLAVQALAISMGIEIESFGCLANFPGVCGRMERIQNKDGLNIFVDYAHTPDALTNVLSTLKHAGFKRIITVFGCGGNRDKTKRPLMGKAVAYMSDIAILTSDNPRFEDPIEIINDIKPGMSGCPKIIIEPDRKKATRKAIDLLKKEDALLIAGKGHEDYQIINANKNHYSDQEIVREFLNCG